MLKMSDIKIRAYDEVWNAPIKSYSVSDPDGKMVTVDVKIPEHHSSSHLLETTPTFFYNLGVVINQPTELSEVSVSAHPAAINARKHGQVVTYKRKNFISGLGISQYENWQGDEVSVVVIYPFNEKEDNHTLTYFINLET